MIEPRREVDALSEMSSFVTLTDVDFDSVVAQALRIPVRRIGGGEGARGAPHSSAGAVRSAAKDLAHALGYCGASCRPCIVLPPGGLKRITHTL